MRHKLMLIAICAACALAVLVGCGERELRGDPWDPLGLHLR